jgi:hypothetical protein
MENIYAGVFLSSNHDKESLDDDVISFFIHCYHVRDWIIHLNKLGITARDVDSYIDSHHALRICADLANGLKHCKLKRTLRTNDAPHIAVKTRKSSTSSFENSGDEFMKCTYSFLSDGEFIDALELATKCVQLWGIYIQGLHNLSNKNINKEISQ